MSTFSALYGVYSVINGRFCVTLPIPAADPSLSSRTIIVTGANTGLGFESCLHLARIGVGKLILAIRTLSKGEEAKSKILAASSTTINSDAIEVWELDMDNNDSIKAFALRVETLPRIDGVLANAGIMTAKFQNSAETIPASKDNGEAERIEQTLQVNVLGTFYLYLLLLPKMRASGKHTGEPCRFVIPNSALHYTAPTKELVEGLKDAQKASVHANATSILDRLNDEKKADMEGRYALTKLLVLYAIREFASRANASGKVEAAGNVIINTPNPSFCKSGLARENQGDKNFERFEKLMARTAEEGSRVLVHGLLAGKDTNGAYLSNCQVEIPARHVTSQWGQKVQKRLVDEMLVKLERVHPGISASV